MAEPFEQERAIAIEAVREASALCRAVRRELAAGVLAKADLSPVTVADFGSQALVCRRLAGAFPADPVVAEEDAAELRGPENGALLESVCAHVAALQAGADAEAVCRWIDHGGASSYSERFWTLDPIDGTKGYLRGGQYAIALALVVDGQIEVAALACPALLSDDGAEGAIFSAVRGQGARSEPLDGGPSASIRVSPCDDPAASRLCESVESGHSAHGDAGAVAARLGITTEPARLDSQAKYAVVARGGAEAYLRLPTRADYREKIWDHAAGALIAAEAGGRVTDILGRPLDFRHGRELAANRGVVVTNGRLHDRVIAALAALGIARE